MRRLVAMLPAVALLAGASTALGAFPQDPPNDPTYASAERDCAANSVNDEQYNLYSFISRCTPTATDPEHASGMSVDRAWARFTTGRPGVTLAYIEGGINWHGPDVRDLADQVFLNRGELPFPQRADGSPCATYDCNGDGRFNAADYAHDSRVRDANGNRLLDPEDLIVAFGHCRVANGRLGACPAGGRFDNDHNGYPNDVSGWDFYDNQNDPATTEGAYLHANGQQRRAAGAADNGFEGAGVCPGCTILPIKAGAEALDRTDDLAQAWLYAGDMHASVIVSVTADLGYSTFMRQAVESLWRRGIVMVESSNDFDSTDHQGGMFHPHVIPGNGLVSNTQGVPGPQANPLTRTFRARSGETSWGTHNFSSISTQGGSTSESTPTHGGVFGLVLSEGRTLKRPLTGPEAVQVVRATASDIDDPGSNWPSKPGWDLQFGYGRPNAFRALEAVARGDVPPVGWISTPDWYALFDPTRERTVPVTGHVEARRSRGYRWKLQAAPGAEPTDADFFSIGSGSGSRPRDGRLGSLNLSRIPRGFWAKAFTLSKTKTLETNEAYTVTLRLRVIDARGRVGEDRRSIAVAHDRSWRTGFPKRIGPSGEAQPQLADLQGIGHLALVFGDSDGVVHAIDGVSGRELPGWPVTTDATRVTRRHGGVDPGHEPVIANAAIGDLDRNGRLSVVVTSVAGRVYVFDAHGRRRAGWPRALASGVSAPAIPRPDLGFTRLPQRGASAPPVLVDLAGSGRLDVVQAGWDGRLHAWRPDGRDLPGWPVEVTVPARLAPARGQVRIDDHKLDTPPAVADLDGDGRPELVLRSQYADAAGAGIQPFGQAIFHAYRGDGTPVPGWPRKLPATAIYYGSAQEFITEGTNAPVAAPVGGGRADEVAASPIFSPTYLLRGDGSTDRVYGAIPAATLAGLAQALSNPISLLQGNQPPETSVSFTGSGAFGKVGSGGLSYAEPGSGLVSIIDALLVTGSGLPIVNAMRAFDATSGAPVGGYPASAQGLDFLGGPAIADIDGDGRPDVLEGGDTSALHGFGSGGAQVRGFPKFTTGWVVYAPVTGDLAGDGRTDVVAMTREGYLFSWRTRGRAAGNREWWSFRHDERNTARYGADTRPPGAVRQASLDGAALRFRAPGGDWYDGTPARYLVTARHRTVSVSAAAPAGSRVTVPVALGGASVRVQAVDAAGNLGAAVVVRRRQRPAQAGPVRRARSTAPAIRR